MSVQPAESCKRVMRNFWSWGRKLLLALIFLSARPSFAAGSAGTLIFDLDDFLVMQPQYVMSDPEDQLGSTFELQGQNGHYYLPPLTSEVLTLINEMGFEIGFFSSGLAERNLELLRFLKSADGQQTLLQLSKGRAFHRDDIVAAHASVLKHLPTLKLNTDLFTWKNGGAAKKHLAGVGLEVPNTLLFDDDERFGALGEEDNLVKIVIEDHGSHLIKLLGALEKILDLRKAHPKMTLVEARLQIIPADRHQSSMDDFFREGASLLRLRFPCDTLLERIAKVRKR